MVFKVKGDRCACIAACCKKLEKSLSTLAWLPIIVKQNYTKKQQHKNMS